MKNKKGGISSGNKTNKIIEYKYSHSNWLGYVKIF